MEWGAVTINDDKPRSDVSRSSIWIYGSLGFPLALLGYPLGIWLPRAYDTYIGIDTAMVGAIIVVAAIFDAITHGVSPVIRPSLRRAGSSA